jgi:hypothetical protein
VSSYTPPSGSPPWSPPPEPSRRAARRPPRRPGPGRALRTIVYVLAALLVVLVAAVVVEAVRHREVATAPTSPTTAAAPHRPAPTSGAPTRRADLSQLIVAVTTAGAVVELDPATGAVTRTLVASGAITDELSVSPDGRTVYYASANGCLGQIDSVPVGGGTPTVIAPGTYPDVSPDGTKLVFARQPDLTQTGCAGSGNLASQISMVVRNLRTGAERSYPLDPSLAASGLPLPIDHLSWGPDNRTVVVSIASPEDNEGWNLVEVDTATAAYYDTPATDGVPMTGADSTASYYREGVATPSGQLFVARFCCVGETSGVSSVLIQVVNPSDGSVADQIAVGYPTLDHTSLDVDPTGRWYLYLSGTNLEVSQGGARPVQLASGYVAAAW